MENEVVKCDFNIKEKKYQIYKINLSSNTEDELAKTYTFNWNAVLDGFKNGSVSMLHEYIYFPESGISDSTATCTITSTDDVDQNRKIIFIKSGEEYEDDSNTQFFKLYRSDYDSTNAKITISAITTNMDSDYVNEYDYWFKPQSKIKFIDRKITINTETIDGEKLYSYINEYIFSVTPENIKRQEKIFFSTLGDDNIIYNGVIKLGEKSNVPIDPNMNKAYLIWATPNIKKDVTVWVDGEEVTTIKDGKTTQIGFYKNGKYAIKAECKELSEYYVQITPNEVTASCATTTFEYLDSYKLENATNNKLFFNCGYNYYKSIISEANVNNDYSHVKLIFDPTIESFYKEDFFAEAECVTGNGKSCDFVRLEKNKIILDRNYNNHSRVGIITFRYKESKECSMLIAQKQCDRDYVKTNLTVFNRMLFNYDNKTIKIKSLSGVTTHPCAIVDTTCNLTSQDSGLNTYIKIKSPFSFGREYEMTNIGGDVEVYFTEEKKDLEFGLGIKTFSKTNVKNIKYPIGDNTTIPVKSITLNLGDSDIEKAGSLYMLICEEVLGSTPRILAASTNSINLSDYLNKEATWEFDQVALSKNFLIELSPSRVRRNNIVFEVKTSKDTTKGMSVLTDDNLNRLYTVKSKIHFEKISKTNQYQEFLFHAPTTTTWKVEDADLQEKPYSFYIIGIKNKVNVLFKTKYDENSKKYKLMAKLLTPMESGLLVFKINVIINKEEFMLGSFFLTTRDDEYLVDYPSDYNSIDEYVSVVWDDENTTYDKTQVIFIKDI